MRWLSWPRLLWRALASRSAFEAEMDEELRNHIELRTLDLVRAGLHLTEARRRARIEFGSVEMSKESVREARGLRLFDEVRGDVRYGLRSLARTPAFAAVAVITLALGIGANTVIFSVADAVLFRPLPFAEPDRLVLLDDIGIGFDLGGNVDRPSPDISDARALEDVFTGVAAYAPGSLNLSDAGAPRRIRVGVVTTEFFATLGVQPARGRGFTEEEGLPEASAVAVVSDAFWRTHLGADEDLLGRLITLNGRPHAVVGVMPHGFAFPDRAEVWMPLSVPITRTSLEPFRQYLPSLMIARLAPGVSIERARDRVGDLFTTSGSGRRDVAGSELVLPLQPRLAGGQRNALLVLLGTTGIVLLLACANVANLLLSRGAARRHEFAMRASLGATPARVLRQLLVESLVLAGIGGALGGALAFLCIPFLDVLVPPELAGAAPVRLDGRVLSFTLMLSVATGLAFGMVPALGLHRADPGVALKSGSTGAVSDRYGVRVRQAFVLSEVTVAVMLLIGSALMLRSLATLLSTDPGLQPERVATLELTLARADFPDVAARRRFYEGVLERLSATPQIEAAGAINELPLRGQGGVLLPVYPEGRDPTDPDLPRGTLDLQVTPDYFEAMGISVLLGRPPRPRTDTLSMREVAINRTLAQAYWQDGNPIGERLEWPNGELSEIVAVVADVRLRSLDVAPYGQMYHSLLDAPYPWAALVARGRLPANELTGLVVDAVHAVAPRQAVYNVRTMDEVIAGGIAPWRTNTILIGTFGLLALGLAVIGVFGIIAFSVARRTREMGIRIALGARPSHIRRVALREALVPTSIGTVLGVGGAWILSRTLSSLVYGVTTHDPIAFTLAPVVLIAAATLAALVPAQSATRVDPIQAIRAE